MQKVNDEQLELHAVFHGRVQGVAFRYSTERYALEIGVVGEVRNQPDGSVEVIAQGTVTQLEQLLRQLCGPSGPGHVETFDKIFCSPTRSFETFEIAF